MIDLFLKNFGHDYYYYYVTNNNSQKTHNEPYSVAPFSAILVMITIITFCYHYHGVFNPRLLLPTYSFITKIIIARLEHDKIIKLTWVIINSKKIAGGR
ncbi:MAG: hypothetical protein ACJ72S_04355 [Nitrososphaeraceae archaeon]